MPGSVVGIHVAARKGAPMESVSSVECRRDHGLVGDRYARAGARGQVTVVSREQLVAASERLGAAIGPGATRRNVTVEGVEIPGKGGRIVLGAIVLEVTAPAAPCDQMNECIAPAAREALENLSGVRARVIAGGTLSVGDPASVEPKASEATP